MCAALLKAFANAKSGTNETRKPALLHLDSIKGRHDVREVSQTIAGWLAHISNLPKERILESVDVHAVRPAALL